ncbi:PREDICTED: serine/arginine-rich splicing factor RS2Z32-like [Diuraphis noxia]|uniref:serine/arginine-rich splicing factor RS2Z32-like n=1 Tax=Diuraphis noxia TaxID=143948 RepID=UPI00076395EC|nr:PREDICTED: serine/arginine-rich splicing factor RS2Z32-like [Diuraphis noxia]
MSTGKRSRDKSPVHRGRSPPSRRTYRSYSRSQSRSRSPVYRSRKSRSRSYSRGRY